MVFKNQTLDDTYLQLVSQKTIYGNDLRQSLNNIVEISASSLSVQRVDIWFLSEGSHTLEKIAHYNAGSDSESDFCHLETRLHPDYFRTLLNNRMIVSYDTANDTRLAEIYPSYLKPNQIQSLIYAGIRHNGRLAGVLTIEVSNLKRQWSREEEVFVQSLADLVSQHIIVDQLARSKTSYQSLFDSSSEGIIIFSQGVFHDVNPACCKIFRGKRSQLKGMTPFEVSPSHQPDGQASDQKAMAYITACLEGHTQNFEWRHMRLDGSEFDAEITLNRINVEGEETLFAMVRDISEQKKIEREAKLAEQALKYRATHDELTGLNNRSQLHGHINKLIEEHSHAFSSPKLALMLLDLNRFKEVNDTLGHVTGDKVLVEVANILQDAVKNIGGQIFRFGGDEFVAVFSEYSCALNFYDLPQAFRQYLKTPIHIDDIYIELGASIGIALFPDHGNDSNELLRCADVAMYRDKNNESQSPFYNPDYDVHNKRRLSMVVELGSSIRNDELALHFQPRINLQTRELSGFEALVRWHHPKFGFVPPSEFIPLAEMTELIHPLTEWVLNEVGSTLKKLNSLGYSFPVAFNVSARNLTDNKLADAIKNLLEKDGISAQQIEIEITESALIDNPQRALKNLRTINDLGISIAIDDFGTGYSSLSYLKQMPVSTLKVDQSFVKEILSSQSDSVIVDSTISLAHNFSYIAVAEGIEDERIFKLLIQKNCDQGQGYYIAKPMDYENLIQWIDGYDRSVKSRLFRE